MRRVKICDPVAHNPYPTFVHNTTTYVGIPHGSPSQLFVGWDTPCRVCLQSGGREIVCRDSSTGEVVMPLSELPAPAPVAELFADWLKPLLRKHDSTTKRLYAFSVVIKSLAPGNPVLATYDFHVLCPVEYADALSVNQMLRTDPARIAPASIADCTEGQTCPDCRRVRQQQKP